MNTASISRRSEESHIRLPRQRDGPPATNRFEEAIGNVAVIGPAARLSARKDDLAGENEVRTKHVVALVFHGEPSDVPKAEFRPRLDAPDLFNSARLEVIAADQPPDGALVKRNDA